jgi:hypothetical protein
MIKAVVFRTFSTAAAFKVGFFSNMSAATEAAWGVAIEVPPT